MVDVSRWLAEQGLGHHAETFARNGIGADVLCDLTDPDLKELGLNLGDLKRMLKAVAALKATRVADRLEGAEAPTAAPPRDAERRQLTVMLVDLVGSTALSAKLDPEEMRLVIAAYRDAVAAEVARFDGFVARFLGDGLLAYFGWPQAYEENAERAVQAGLALTQAIGELPAPTAEPLAARVGIATGQVVVGDLLGGGTAEAEAVIGATPNLAARLQELAGPGEIVIAGTTR